MESLFFIVIAIFAIGIVLLFSLTIVKKKEKKQNQVKLVDPKEMYINPKKIELKEVEVNKSITNPLTSSDRPIVERKKEVKKEEPKKDELPDDYRKLNMLQNINTYNSTNKQNNVIPSRQMPTNQALNNTNNNTNLNNKPYNNVNLNPNNFKNRIH